MTLSDKIVMDFVPEDKGLVHENFIWKKDVKEFISKLKETLCAEDICKRVDNSQERDCFTCEQINKLAGDALIHSSPKSSSPQENGGAGTSDKMTDIEIKEMVDKMTDIEIKEMVDEMLGSDKTDDFVHKCPCNDCIGKDGSHGSHNKGCVKSELQVKREVWFKIAKDEGITMEEAIDKYTRCLDVDPIHRPQTLGDIKREIDKTYETWKKGYNNSKGKALKGGIRAYTKGCTECGFEEKYHKVREIRGYMGLKKPCKKFKRVKSK